MVRITLNRIKLFEKPVHLRRKIAEFVAVPELDPHTSSSQKGRFHIGGDPVDRSGYPVGLPDGKQAENQGNEDIVEDQRWKNESPPGCLGLGLGLV